MQDIIFDGKKVRAAIFRSGFTKEQVVAFVQEEGIRFSLAGLDRIYKNKPPKKELESIMAAIAKKIKCKVGDFRGPPT